MTSLDHSNNLSFVTLHFPSSTPPPSSGVSLSSTSSTGWTERITKKIEELKKHLDDLKKRKNDNNPQLTEQDSMSLDSLPTQLTSLETVRKLAEFADQLDTAKTNSNNILNNLCDGLEKFVGFNSATKGYDGTGIVYSDLDRLCDAVMGFLSGVLSNIQGHLGQHKDTLNAAINILNEKKHLGKNGFNVAIGEVVKGVRGYNGKVKRSKGNVRSITSKLLQYVTHGGDFSRDFNGIRVDEVAGSPEVKDAQVTKVEKLVNECRQRAREFGNNIRRADKDVADFNPQLRQNIQRVKINIAQESTKLKDIHAKQQRGLEATEKIIKETLHGLNCNVNKKIKVNVEKLVDELKDAVTMIRKELETINKNLINYITALERWIEEAEAAVKAALLQVDAIIDEVDENKKKAKNKEAIEMAAEFIRGLSSTLNEDFAFKNAQFKQAVEEIDRASAKLGTLNETVKGMVPNTGRSNIQDHLGLGEEILQLKGKIRSEMKSHIGGMLEVLKGSLRNISRGSGRTSTQAGLPVVVDHVISYVKKYGEHFETAMQSWVSEIVRRMMTDGGPLHEHIYSYVEGIQSNKVDSGQLFSEVTRKLKDKITEVLQSIASSNKYGMKTSGKVDENLESIQTFLSKFSGQEFLNNVSTIVEKIESDSQLGIVDDSKGRIYNAELTSAVKIVLHIISTACEQLGAGIKKLAGECNLTKINDALNAGNDLIDKIGAAIKQSKGHLINVGDPDDGPLVRNIKEISTKIDKVDHELKGLLKQTADAGIQKLHEKIQKDVVEGIIHKIDKDVAKHEQSANNTYAAIVQRVNEITGGLFQLCTSIKQAAESDEASAKNKLRALKDTYFNKLHNKNNSIHKICGDLIGLQTTLERGALKMARGFADHADKTCRSIIEPLNKEVNGEIADAQTKIVTAARCNYVTSVKALLTAFADKVEKELKGLPEEIDADLTIGFKGMMKTLEDGSTDKDDTDKSNINLLSNLVSQISSKDLNHKDAFEMLSKNFQKFFWPLKAYISGEIKRLHNEENEKNQKPVSAEAVYTAKLGAIDASFNDLLEHLHETHRYDYKVPEKLAKLSEAITELRPKNFNRPNTPVIDAMTDGLREFIGELMKVYISRYDSEVCGELIKDYKQEATLRGVFEKYELTEEGRDCAKVCLSVIPIVYNEFTELKNKFDDDVNTWKTYKIYNSLQPDQSLHKLFFGENGYDVRISHDATNGELNHKEGYNGKCIFDMLTKDTHQLFESSKRRLSLAAPSVGDSQEPEVEVAEIGIIPKLYHYLENYFGVCHLIGHAKPRHPCSVYEMLCWLTGLPHNTAYKKLEKHIRSLFVVTDKSDPSKKIPKPIHTSHSTITASNVLTAVEEICGTSYAVLTAVVGTGDAATHYACELPNNSSRLIYPTNGADCLDTLLDILRRIFPVLQFLHAQCRLKTKHYGWYNCEYGRDIRQTKWPCNEHTEESTKVPTKEPTKCLPKSPLQSYLNDCLPGHLPHQLSSIGCKAECHTCPKKPDGRPCLTPMGFRGFSGSTKTGKDLCSVLSKFFGIPQVNSLVCLIPKPPSTLSEHFGFALSLVEGWHTWRSSGSVNPLQAAIENHISEVSMDLVKRGTISNALRDAYGSSREKHLKHVNDSPDMCSLSMNMTCPGRDANCAPYIYTLCTDSYDYLVYKNCNLYLSWAIYLPWSFWDLLNNLYNAFCSINCHDWGCRGCLRGDKCKKGQHGSIHETTKQSNCQCRSIVDCKGVAPTLYQFGFVFGEASTLNDKQSPKKCSDFCSQLKNVLNSEYFKKLFKECDNFLWKIREPFSYLVLALWLLSLLYLTHIMVIRLDLLHIKSHLHTPSSHRIAAQSLLAAARVSKLNRVFYLQP